MEDIVENISEDKNKIWGQFLNEWPVSKLADLTLEQYVSVEDKTTFAY